MKCIVFSYILNKDILIKVTTPYIRWQAHLDDLRKNTNEREDFPFERLKSLWKTALAWG